MELFEKTYEKWLFNCEMIKKIDCDEVNIDVNEIDENDNLVEKHKVILTNKTIVVLKYDYVEEINDSSDKVKHFYKIGYEENDELYIINANVIEILGSHCVKQLFVDCAKKEKDKLFVSLNELNEK